MAITFLSCGFGYRLTDRLTNHARGLLKARREAPYLADFVGDLPPISATRIVRVTASTGERRSPEGHWFSVH